MLFQNKVSQEFANKVVKICSDLDIKPDWLMAIMNHESGLNHTITNSIGCVGLIQFCFPKSLGVTADQLRSMTAVQQLDYVYNYYKPYKNRIFSFVDLGLVSFYPYALKHSKDPNYVFGSEVSIARARVVRDSNKGFDVNNDGVISMQDYQDYMRSKFSGYPTLFEDLPVSTQLKKKLLGNSFIIFGGLLFLVIGLLIFKS